jgi:uncharacterized membrane protein YhfC
VAFRTLLKKARDRDAAVFYGIGHGGFESIFLVGFPLVGILVAAHLDATGALPSGPGVDQLRQHVGQFTVVGSLAAAVLAWATRLAARPG